jgi:hypothetical protein
MDRKQCNFLFSIIFSNPCWEFFFLVLFQWNKNDVISVPDSLLTTWILFYPFLFVLHLAGSWKVFWLFAKGLSRAKRAKEIIVRRQKPNLLMEYLHVTELDAMRWMGLVNLRSTEQMFLLQEHQRPHTSNCSENEDGRYQKTSQKAFIFLPLLLSTS